MAGYKGNSHVHGMVCRTYCDFDGRGNRKTSHVKKCICKCRR